MLVMAALADARSYRRNRRELENEIEAELDGTRSLSSFSEDVAGSSENRRELADSVEPPSKE